MTEKQKHLLKLLREIDEICKRHHLRYVMAGGSLIGVVRNEGFIPWDDDVDIYMPGDDWDKFVELSRTEFPPDRAVQCVDVDREFTNTFPRYADTASCAIHRHQLIGNDKAGEIIDVLTLDPIPPDDKEYEKYRTHMMIYSELVNVAYVYCNRWEIPVTMYLKYLAMYFFLGKDRTLKKLEKIMYSYKEEDCDRYAMRWGGCPFLFDKDMMFPVKYMNFEGIQVMVPNRVSDYLIWHYGDEWSYIPPHEERTSHNSISVEGITYQELRDDYMKKVDAGKIRKNSIIRKIFYIATSRKRYDLRRKRNLLKAKGVEMDLNARICESGRPLAELVERHEFSALNDIFKEYYQLQLSAEFIGREDFANIHPFYHPILLGVSDEVFLAAMMTLIYTERVAKAYRMLQVKEKLDRLTPEMQQLVEDIILFRKAACHYEMKEKEEAEKICRELLTRYPDCPGFMKLECRLVMGRAERNGDFSDAAAFVGRALELFPDDGYFLKYQADLLLKKEGEEAALPLYAEAKEKTNNGITHLEIHKYLETRKENAFHHLRCLILQELKEEALAWMKLWERLLPEDDVIPAYTLLVKASLAQNTEERGEAEKELRKKIAAYENKWEESDAVKVLREALQVILMQKGYSHGMAEMETEVLLTTETSRLQELSDRLYDQTGLKNIKKDGVYEGGRDYAAAYKILGDIEKRLGSTRLAFEAYQKALEQVIPDGIREEIQDIILRDLYFGGKKAVAIAKKTDAMEFLNQWLGKYGDLQEVMELVKKRNGAEIIE